MKAKANQPLHIANQTRLCEPRTKAARKVP